MSARRARYVLLCQQAFACAAVCALLAPAARVVTLDIVSPSRTATEQNSQIRRGAALVASRPVAPRVREVALAPPRSVSRAVDGAASSRLPNGRIARVAAVTGVEPVEGLATVGVTWQHGSTLAEDAVSISVRTAKHGVWSAWETLPYHDDHGPDVDSEEARHARPGTDPVVVGAVDDVQVVVATADGAAPADLELSIIDPGATAAPVVEQPAINTAELSGAPASRDGLLLASSDVTPKPEIFSRAQWGADERMRDASSLHYGEVHAAFVHHTVNANDYTRAEVPAILRGIYAYHTQSRGWSDIGYNFLVDRFGRIWEGRYGGVSRPVVGAHTLGYNDDAMAMSAIGNFEIARPSAAMLDAYARLFAWKLSLHGVRASSTRQWVTSKYFQAINGHLDAGQTACPGKYLYAQLHAIRAAAAAYQRPFTSRDLDAQVSGSAWPDLLVRNASTKNMEIVRTAGQTRYLPARTMSPGWGGTDLIAALGDVTGDGWPDLAARTASSGVTGVYPGTPSGTVSAPVATTTRFADHTMLFGVGDMDGDGRKDLAGRDGAGRLMLYPGRGGGSFGAGNVLASSWTKYNLTDGVGDFDGDGAGDLVAREASGALYLVRGTGTGDLRAPQLLPGSFAAADLISGRGDVTNDGRPDLIVRDRSSGLTRIYQGDGHGGLGIALGAFTVFHNLSWISGTTQVAGSAHHDIVGRNRAGALVVFANTGGRNLGRVVRTSVSLAGTNLLLNVGDWNHDGYGDAMSRTTDGRMLLRLGQGHDTFAAPVVAASGWDTVTQVASVGDVTGDGNNDLMGRSGSTGPFKIHPGNGTTGFRAGYVAHSAVTSNREVALGLYDSDGAPDTMITKTDGSLWLYPGNGPGGMTDGRQVGAGLSGYDWVVGLGDLDGDGRPDLLARGRANGALYMYAGTASGFPTRRFVGAGFAGYDLAG